MLSLDVGRVFGPSHDTDRPWLSNISAWLFCSCSPTILHVCMWVDLNTTASEIVHLRMLTTHIIIINTFQAASELLDKRVKYSDRYV